jgi:hypothetical protein
MTHTNPNALDFDRWASENDDIARWKIRRLAISASHLDWESKIIS